MQYPAKGLVPGDDSKKQAEKIPEPQVAPADSEHQIQPGPAETGEKQQITEDGKPGAEGAEKTVPDSKEGTQKVSGGKPLECNSRYGHPNSRRHPPSRGSS